jgi:hypothetical protein
MSFKQNTYVMMRYKRITSNEAYILHIWKFYCRKSCKNRIMFNKIIILTVMTGLITVSCTGILANLLGLAMKFSDSCCSIHIRWW